MRCHVSNAFHEIDVTFEPDLWIRHVRLREGKPAPGTQVWERLSEAGVEIDVVKDAHSDDGVELPLSEALTGFDVPDQDLGVVADSLAADRCGHLAELEPRQDAAGCRETLG